jgi:predicted amidohydrolase
LKEAIAMTRPTTVAAAQLGPYAESKEAVVKRMTALMEAAAGAGVEILTYPELALSPYFAKDLVEDWEQWFEAAMPSPLTAPLFEVAKAAGITFILPYAEKENGHYYNSLAVVLPSGEIAGKYRKMHIPGFAEPQPGRQVGLEKRYFADGDLGFPVYQAPGAKIGTLICYDRRFPEAYRSYQLGGAEVVFVAYNTGSTGRPLDFMTMQSELVMRANAYQHGLWVVASGKAGIEDSVPYIGGSCIISPDGEIFAKAKTVGDELVTATIDLDLAAEREQTMRMCANRRPEMYRLSTEPAGALVAG